MKVLKISLAALFLLLLFIILGYFGFVGKTKDDKDVFGLKMLYPSASENAREWHEKWANAKPRQLVSGERDPFDYQLMARGIGVVSIDGKGVAKMSGEFPRLYVYDAAKKKKWNNVEVTVYMKRISETGTLPSQGLVVGARSEHQDAEDNPCLGQTYYGKLLYDGRAIFQKEIIHSEIYSVGKPDEEHKAPWEMGDDAVFPKEKWIGMKFVVRTNPDKSVSLELYRDLTNGDGGGLWEKITEYTDDGEWKQTDTGTDAEVFLKCRHPINKVLLEPGTSVFIRNDSVGSAEYKWFSIREIE